MYQPPSQGYPPPYPQQPQPPQKKFPTWAIVLIVVAAILCNVVGFLMAWHP